MQRKLFHIVVIMIIACLISYNVTFVNLFEAPMLAIMKQTFRVEILVRLQPHTGARYPDGTLGYIAPVTAIRNKILTQIKHEHNATPMNFLPLSDDEFQKACNVTPGKGPERELGWDLLVNAMKVDGLNEPLHKKF